MANVDPPPSKRELVARFLTTVIRSSLAKRGLYLTEEEFEPLASLDVPTLQQIVRSVLPPEPAVVITSSLPAYVPVSPPPPGKPPRPSR